MSNSFFDALSDASNRQVRTANGAVTLESSKSAVLDFFSTAGAFRSQSESTIKNAFGKAFAEDKNLAMKALFYLRDCRGGQGERKVFRACWSWLIENYPEIARKNDINVPFYGRWDDMFFDEKSMKFAFENIKAVVGTFNAEEDLISFNDLTMFKWLPSINTSSQDTRKLANLLRATLNLTPRQYRKMLSRARAKLGVLERDMSAGNWSGIKFEKVPSRASLLYRKAFWKHTPELYKSYLDKVEKGEAKINTSVTYPYEIVREYLIKRDPRDKTLDLAWANLPDYIGEDSGIVLADVSGSMDSPNYMPISVSISLAMYMAERNKNPVFKNKFITFTSSPRLMEIKGETLFEKIQNINRAEWSSNTNLQAAFDLILSSAVKAAVPAEDMPKKLYIVSDMEFDSACRDRTNFEVIKQKYAAAGYEMPRLVFWNVNARPGNQPVKMDEEGTALVSGCSPSIFKSLMASKILTPYDLMLEVLLAERYSKVTA